MDKIEYLILNISKHDNSPNATDYYDMTVDYNSQLPPKYTITSALEETLRNKTQCIDDALDELKNVWVVIPQVDVSSIDIWIYKGGRLWLANELEKFIVWRKYDWWGVNTNEFYEFRTFAFKL